MRQGPPASRQRAEGAPNGGTPNIKVGDNVLVGGVKPGVVAFLGTTQFAPGIWAGIVLDSYDGKNNGTVKGVSYFQCEPNRGLFSKPDKLTLAPKTTQQPSRTEPKITPTPQGPSRGDSTFEVGDRVLVEGVKPGIVGFIGETQFARGVWAGIILDTADGKNNGSVAGVQYFQCDANHGLFTRPQKLVLVEKAGSATPTPTQPASTGGPRIQTAQRIPQDSRSTGSQERAQSATRQAQPTPSDLKALQDKLKIGDHVLVGGAKEGTLRFLGPTEFAKGIWAGVELPEPMGKNDGAVSGKR